MKNSVFIVLIFVVVSGVVDLRAQVDDLTVEKAGVMVVEPEAGAEQGTITIPVSCPAWEDCRITDHPLGKKIEVDGYGFINMPGEPMLPSKTLLIALPPGATALSATFETEGNDAWPQACRIMPASRKFPMVDPDTCAPILDRADLDWNRNHAKVYRDARAFPRTPGELCCSGSYRQYAYAAVSFCPFVYHPLTGRLARFERAWITVRYEQSEKSRGMKRLLKKITTDETVRARAASLFVNFEKMEKQYAVISVVQDEGLGAENGGSPVMSRLPQRDQSSNKRMLPDIGCQPLDPQSPKYDYLIITHGDLTQSIMDSDFPVWKESLGFNLKIVETTDPHIANAMGQDLPQKIRNFLRSNYLLWGIEYVLIVGHHNQIPMRNCCPNPANHGDGHLTDYYYADLSLTDGVSWDSDGDGFYGEYDQDAPDFMADVYVGRIPTSDSTRITYALNKMVAYEQDTGAWKRQALLPSSFWYFADELFPGLPTMDGARCQNEIEQQVMDDWTVSLYSEQEGIEPSLFPWQPVTQSAWISDWAINPYGVVVWSSHGSNLGSGVVRKYWDFDDGDGKPEPQEFKHPALINVNSAINDLSSSIVFAFSCYVGNPKPTGKCLGKDLLVRPGFGRAAGVVASSKILYAEEFWPTNPGGTDTICLEFCRNMIDGNEPLGEALYHAKHFNHVNYGWSMFPEYVNMYIWNLFGDPSMVQAGTQ